MWRSLSISSRQQESKAYNYFSWTLQFLVVRWNLSISKLNILPVISWFSCCMPCGKEQIQMKRRRNGLQRCENFAGCMELEMMFIAAGCCFVCHSGTHLLCCASQSLALMFTLLVHLTLGLPQYKLVSVGPSIEQELIATIIQKWQLYYKMAIKLMNSHESHPWMCYFL